MKGKNRKGNKGNVDRRYNKPIYNKPPMVDGKDIEQADTAKIKTVNEDTLKRSIYNNMIVDKLEFYSPSGKRCSVSGNQLLLYTLSPSKPLIDCPHISLKITHNITNNERGDYITRLCTFNKNPGEFDMCYTTIDKIAKGLCVGKKTHMSSHEFFVINDGHIQIDENEREFKTMFINKNINSFLKEEFRENPDLDKAKVLWNLYNAMRAGTVKASTVPKPGNVMFYAVFNGVADVDIETITGENINGTIKGYELTPGGTPSLNMWISQEKLRVVPLYTVATIIVGKYDVSDILNRRAIELTIKGHIVIPHRGNNLIYDYCKSYKKLNDQEIKLDGNITQYEQLDKHDMEVSKIIRSIN